MQKTTYFVSTEIEGNALAQVGATEAMPEIEAIAVYPDIHYCDEKAIPVGLAFATREHIFPLVTGKDMGCGVAYLRVPKRDVLRPFDKGEHYAALNHYQNSFTDERLGGGNHFLSIEEDDAAWYVVCHTGTRNRGIYMYQANWGILDRAGGGPSIEVGRLLEERPDWFERYNEVLDYGRDRRAEFCYRTLQFLVNCGYVRGEKDKSYLSKGWAPPRGSYEYGDSIHNHIKKEGDLYIHRKGSTELGSGTVVMPLSMTRGSLLVRKVYEDPRALNSCAHGAGRKLSRTDTLKYWHSSLKERERKQYREQFGEMLSRNGEFSNGYLQEFDFAYKDSGSILADQPYLAKVTETRPIVTFKFTEI
jgi:tRNA-splicing ligase RtcB/release factor H-coupled RctB family protein